MNNPELVQEMLAHLKAWIKVDLMKKWKKNSYCVATWTILTVTKSEKGKVQMMKSTEMTLKYSNNKRKIQIQG